MKNEYSETPGHTRRIILKGAAGLAALGFGGGALTSAHASADAKAWPENAFKQKNEVDALKALYGKTAEASDKVNLDAPEIAENGAVVPISVATTMPGVTGIAIMVLENPYTLAAAYKIPEGTEGSVACRLKMAKTSEVVAIVEVGDKLFSATKEVKVTVGGCGG